VKIFKLHKDELRVGKTQECKVGGYKVSLFERNPKRPITDLTAAHGDWHGTIEREAIALRYGPVQEHALSLSLSLYQRQAIEDQAVRT
jgi:hypothetical protein